MVGTLAPTAGGHAPPGGYAKTRVHDVVNSIWVPVGPGNKLQKALHLQTSRERRLLVIVSGDGALRSIPSQTAILTALKATAAKCSATVAAAEVLQ